MRAFLFPNPTILFPLSGILLLCPCTLLRWPAILLPVVRHSASGVPPFCSRLPAILLPGFPQFYLRCPGLCSHSTFYLPKGSLSPSRFCFSVPNVQYYVTKAHYYHIQANILCNSRTKTSILCSKSPKTRVPNPKKAQKPRFCARKARKQGFQTQIKHKKRKRLRDYVSSV